MNATLRRWVAQTITSQTLRELRRGYAAVRRRLRGKRPTVLYFHQVDDPYSHLAVQVLPALLDCYDIDVLAYLVPAPTPAAAPEAARLAAYARKDAALLAAAHGLSFEGRTAPDPQAISAVANLLADTGSAINFAQAAVPLGEALWRGDAIAPTQGPGETAMAIGGGLREGLGHYLGATFYFESEWYWGLDRLPHLEARLAPFRDKGAATIVQQLEASDTATSDRGATVDFYLSFRSPYTYLAASRVQRLAARCGAAVRLKFVLPMVMRGLPVPRAKRLYIMRDAKREAERLGLPFGRVVDPVGRGVERGLAVLHQAIAQGKGADFTESFLRGVFAEGIDAADDAGLARIAGRAGIAAAGVGVALADPTWRAVAEENRAELFDLGLWGVPSFRVHGCEPHWGQDRLWAVERDLIATAQTASVPAA